MITPLLKSGVGELDGLDDFVTMTLKGEALVEDGAEVEKFGDLGDVEDDHFGFERGDCQVVAVTGGLGRMDETLNGGACVGDEANVVDVEKDIEEGDDERLMESQVGMVTLDGVNDVGDVEDPKEGRETTVFRQVFEDLDVGGVVGETIEDTVHDGVME